MSHTIMTVYLKLLKESFIFSLVALAANKLRTILSLLGITIGIFSIVSVFTAVDSLELQIRDSITDLGDNVLFIQKWPWTFGGDYKWWDYVSRPYPSPNEQSFISKHSEKSLGSAFTCNFSETIKFKSNGIESQTIIGVTAGYNYVRNYQIEKGRYFTSSEISSGNNVCIIGDKVALDLFGTFQSVGRTIKIGGRKTKVIGVFEHEGDGLIGNSLDNDIVLTLNYAKSFIDVGAAQVSPTIYVRAKKRYTNEELKEELIGLMRAKRKLRPREDNDFALNEISIISKGFDSFFDVINLIGTVIGGFSIIVGAVSIANIMFVSVQERTKIIGIQKALGAKNAVILFQFLSESIFLSLIGGIIGLLLIAIITLVINLTTEFIIVLTLGNILIGTSTSIIIGVISGIIPAWQAAKKDPVEAIRSN